MCEKNANENASLEDSDDWMFEWSELELVKDKPERWETIRERWEAFRLAHLDDEGVMRLAKGQDELDDLEDLGALRKQEEGEGDWRVTCAEVAEEAYMGNERLRLVVGNGSPTIIGGMAGYSEIGARAFKECVNLEYVSHIPNSVHAIEEETFAGCRSLRSVNTFPFMLAYIGWHAFAGCESLWQLELPDGLEMICKEAFIGCTGLRIVHFVDYNPALLRGIGARAFANCPNLLVVKIPSDAPLEAIGTSAFEGCAIRELRLPSELKELYPRAFANCRDLELVRLPKRLEPQVEAAFVGCPKVRFEFF